MLLGQRLNESRMGSEKAAWAAKVKGRMGGQIVKGRMGGRNGNKE
jgi:hypothetical protein